MSLQNLQTEFAEAMLNNDQTLERIQPAQHMQIYHHNRLANLIQTLQDTYPLIAKLVGADFFRLLAKNYISRYPACSGNLHEYGEYFSDFLAEQPTLQTLVYLVEVAQFEWICHTLFVAAEAANFDLRKLEKVSPDRYDQLCFTLHPASQLCQFNYPILTIIDLCDGVIDSLDMNRGDAINLLIIRRDLTINLLPLSEAEFAFLTTLHENKPISEALNKALTLDVDFKLEEKLPIWIQNKTIVDIQMGVMPACF